MDATIHNVIDITSRKDTLTRANGEKFFTLTMTVISIGNDGMKRKDEMMFFAEKKSFLEVRA